jgi:endonuclease YncB( thermonuclease family)
MAPVGTRLRVEHDVEQQDQLGHHLAYVYLSRNRSPNEALLSAGMAAFAEYPPNSLYAESYHAVSEGARLQARGLWATPAFGCMPAEFPRRQVSVV